MKYDEIYDVANEYIVPTFPGDHDKRTMGVGFFTEDQSELANSVEDPDTIEAIGIQLIRFASEIRCNRSLGRAPAEG